ncbi:hypothetical protein HMI54_006616 [Coelomomyces lativittatus]|nr:hypothetical protein HMI56_004502 [Coelomomyces lativittatus]KAJ1504782.1 hypothetical protein HMI54_006616 [Coelomomyces lativittatus]
MQKKTWFDERHSDTNVHGITVFIFLYMGVCKAIEVTFKPLPSSIHLSQGKVTFLSLILIGYTEEISDLSDSLQLFFFFSQPWMSEYSCTTPCKCQFKLLMRNRLCILAFTVTSKSPIFLLFFLFFGYPQHALKTFLKRVDS